MLSSPPVSMSTRSGLIAGKKRGLASPVKSKEHKEDNNNTPAKTPRKDMKTPPKKQPVVSTTSNQARSFAKWFQKMIDSDRHNFGLYLADEVILEWFGRTIKTRKKVAGFLEYDMQCSRHDFTLVEGTTPFNARAEKIKRLFADSPQDNELATPLNVPETPTTKLNSSLNRLTVRGSSLKKRSGLRSNSKSPEKGPQSPEWERNALKHRLDDASSSEKKRARLAQLETMDVDSDSGNGKSEKKRPARFVKYCRQLRFEDDAHPRDEGIGEISNKGDTSEDKIQVISTPHKEEGQGDCLPSSSRMNVHTNIIAHLPRKHVECNGFIKFTRSRTKRGADVMQWERKCKVQISYTEDPVNLGEYIIWTIIYSDDIKCRRNLLSAFEEVAKEGDKRKRLF